MYCVNNDFVVIHILGQIQISCIFQVQTRSADEPMTTFVFCNECGNRWKVRGDYVCLHLYLDI